MVVFLSDFSAILLKTRNNLDEDLASDFCSDCSALRKRAAVRTRRRRVRVLGC